MHAFGNLANKPINNDNGHVQREEDLQSEVQNMSWFGLPLSIRNQPLCPSLALEIFLWFFAICTEIQSRSDAN